LRTFSNPSLIYTPRLFFFEAFQSPWWTISPFPPPFPPPHSRTDRVADTPPGVSWESPSRIPFTSPLQAILRSFWTPRKISKLLFFLFMNSSAHLPCPFSLFPFSLLLLDSLGIPGNLSTQVFLFRRTASKHGMKYPCRPFPLFPPATCFILPRGLNWSFLSPLRDVTCPKGWPLSNVNLPIFAPQFRDFRNRFSSVSRVLFPPFLKAKEGVWFFPFSLMLEKRAACLFFDGPRCKGPGVAFPSPLFSMFPP